MEFEKSKLQWLEYDLLLDHSILFARTYLRHGGVSEKNFFSLNVSDRIGDHFDNVKMNRELIRKSLNEPKLVFANQIHSDIVKEVTKDNSDTIFDCDALVTKEKGLALVLNHADCQIALLFDPEYEVIAAVHAGWKGLFKNIYQKTIDFMKDNFNSRKENIIACISPSLCLKHAEFRNYKKEVPKNLWTYQKESFHFDLWQIAIDQFKDAGLQEKNIELAKECTYCNENDYFSFRRDKDTGRNATVICLK
jgi:YfiH family protein